MRMYFVRRWPVQEIAKALKVSEKTVRADLNYIKKYGKTVGDDLLARDHAMVIFELQAKYDERQMLRWQEFQTTKDSKQRSFLLNDIAFDEERHLKMLQSIGAIKKEAETLDLHVTSWVDIVKKAAEERAHEG